MSHLPEHLQPLLDPTTFNHAVEQVELLETHISWIVLTGPYAYKIKKPVELGFVDYTSRQARHDYCFRELRLNRRLAPELYLDVVGFKVNSAPSGADSAHSQSDAAQETANWQIVSLTDSSAHRDTSEPSHAAGELSADSESSSVIEFAVKMKQFSQEQLLPQQLAEGAIQRQHIDQLADRLAIFHAHCESASADSPYGSREQLEQDTRETLEVIGPVCADDQRLSDSFDRLTAWIDRQFTQLAPHFRKRQAARMIKACHGDLHCGNMLLADDEIVVFDGIEFNESYRWIDTLNDLAFAWMDLADRGAPQLAHRLLNRYLEASGDDAGLPAWKLFVVYRALVRAKVAVLRRNQLLQDRQDGSESQTALDQDVAAAEDELRRYVEFACEVVEQTKPWLLLTCGISGSGKSFFAERFAEQTAGIRIRSDIERKRNKAIATAGSPLLQHDQLPELNADDYSAVSTRAVYARLLDLTQLITQAGLPVIVDATFLKRAQREPFVRLADREQLPLCITELHLSEHAAMERLARRKADGDAVSDADAEVLRRQLETREEVGIDELTCGVESPPPDRAKTGEPFRVLNTLENSRDTHIDALVQRTLDRFPNAALNLTTASS